MSFFANLADCYRKRMYSEKSDSLFCLLFFDSLNKIMQSGLAANLGSFLSVEITGTGTVPGNKLCFIS